MISEESRVVRSAATSNVGGGLGQKPSDEVETPELEPDQLKKMPSFKEKFDDITSELTNLRAAGISAAPANETNETNDKSQLADQNNIDLDAKPPAEESSPPRDDYA